MAEKVGISEEEWSMVAKNFMRGQLMTRGLSYAKLAEALAAIGVEETEISIKNKVSRGRFTFAFFLQAMAAIGSSRILLPTMTELGEGGVAGHGGAYEFARKDRGAD